MILLEIAVFFLFIGAVLFLIVSGRLMNWFRDRAPKPLLIVALVTGGLFYHWMNLFSQPMGDSAPIHRAAPEPEVSVEKPEPPAIKRPVKAAPTTPAAAKAAPAAPAGKWDIVIVKEGNPEQVFVPQAKDPVPATTPAPAPVAKTEEAAPAAERSGPDPYESKAKRGIKAVGRFFRLKKSAQ